LCGDFGSLRRAEARIGQKRGVRPDGDRMSPLHNSGDRMSLVRNGDILSPLPCAKENEMKFVATMTLAVSTIVSTACTGDEPLEGEQLRAAVQGICPVSGKQLGSMGQPLKVRIGQEEIFLCCRGCLGGKVKAEHWGTIHANFAKAQGICPVMKKALPANPKWTIVDGRIVYVCCPPCTEKIEADSETYLKMVDAQYAAYVKSQAE
jgi:hypothetical protein